jgi:GT2 family glycosyltransferase
MQKIKHKIALVVATKDRPLELRNMLKSLDSQSCKPDQIIIVDGSAQLVKNVVQEFSHLPIDYVRCLPPSAARQRNVGIRAVAPNITLVGFLDDDAVLEPDALIAIMNYFESAEDNVGGVAFNMVNHPPLYASRLKKLKIVERLGLYSKDKGLVLPSGFHTMIGYISDNIFVQWLPTGATVWQKKIFDQFKFDEWFSGYSYLEDLDFSYQVGKEYRLVVVANAKYYHFPASSGRGNSYIFGKREVVNRIYFNYKHTELSLPKCYMGIFVRMGLSLMLAVKKRSTVHLYRAFGNIAGLIQSVRYKKSVFHHERA